MSALLIVLGVIGLIGIGVLLGFAIAMGYLISQMIKNYDEATNDGHV